MKNKIYRVIAAVLTIVAISAMGINACAFFGVGAQVVASDVNMIKTGLLGQKIHFTDGDFKSALVLADFDSITITEIPASSEGTLMLNGRRVGKGRVIKRKNLGALVFIPTSPSVTECSFKFTVDGYASGAEIECILKFIDKVNYAPKTVGDTVGASSIITQESISVHGNLSATDPEGDDIEFIVVSYPKKGLITINGDSGKYCYTPYDGYRGKDKFSYVVRDEYGNYSTPMTVSVTVNDRMSDVVYLDMAEREEYNAVIALTAMGVMSGVQVGDGQYFYPDEAVTRAELVATAMKCVGIRADSTLTSTYFDDDGDISEPLKGYIATAQRTGLIVGNFKSGKLLFSPNEEITKYEAAKILSCLINAENNNEESVFNEIPEIPVWSRAGVSAMYTLGIYDSEDMATLSNSISRADLAEYLYRISKL